ncbi:FMN-dependent NADH-azoreductase [Microvirga sp. VF16]|uniref:FMN-dependent NADH-azoreductase n=1 Tax=Microvirga sp. VF16 TaxID=2807101 RepID=UPI00193E7696|nr:FMN-dependent NADH-azoreductase [Microvirga sp. VF16]QRM33897.1 FMN-dependent NADH-azoreductase [Microvirga sp. VF16]
MKLLHVDSSILGESSVSRRLTAQIVTAEQAAHPAIEVIRRDLATHPVAHLSGAHLAGQGASPEDPSLLRDLAEGQAALEEFLAADIVVVGAPMYNFTVPSQLKAWIDRLAVAGRTFRYTAEGPEGLAGGKKVVVVSTRGGFYGPETANAALEHQESYLRGIFGFFGITDLSFVRAEGVAVGEQQRAEALQAAEAQIRRLAA